MAEGTGGDGRRKDSVVLVERDSSLSKIDSVRKSSAKRRMSIEARISENKIITIGDYHTPLPEGWSYRESTNHKGKWYYISPEGQAQWIPPLVKTGKLYEWKLHLYIEFGPGKLGMNLKAVDALPDTLWTQFQVEIHTLRKLGNGHASPAELYNWSVKPDRRIYAGFRIVEIAGASVAGFTYSDVIDKINKTPRPVVIGFCDCHRGLVGDPDQVDDMDDDEATKSVYQQRFNTIQSDHMKAMVLTELDKELWLADLKRLAALDVECRAKCKRLRREMAQMNAKNAQLEQLLQQRVAEKRRCITLVSNLDVQQVEMRGRELVKKQHALRKAIADTKKENARLMDQHAADTIALDALYEQLDRDDCNNVLLMTKTQLYDEYGVKRSPFTLQDLHLLCFTLEEAAIVEEQEVQRGISEVAQLRRHVAAMETGGASPPNDDDSSSTSSTRDLEMKLDWLRDQLQKTAQTIAKAEKKGKSKAVKGGYRRRNLLKIEYQLVQDELQTKLQHMGPQPTCPEEPALLDDRTEYIRQALRDVVQHIATCPKDQQKMYLDRRLFLKKELLHVQNRCLELGLPLTRIRRSSSALDDVRPSAFDGTDETPPSGNTPLHYPESLTPNADDFGHGTPEHSGGEDSEGASITTSTTTSSQPPQYVEGYVSGISVQLPSSKSTTGPLPRAEFTTQLTSALSALSRTHQDHQHKPITELHKPQQPITELHKPHQPIKDLKKQSRHPITEFKKQSQHPITQFKKQSQHPITELKKQSQQPITELKKEPQHPITELKKQPQQPITELKKEPEHPITELKKQPQQPITELKKEPQQPITELHKPQQPITELHKPQRPIIELHKPQWPITQFKKPKQPITELQKPQQPIIERKTPQEPIIELQQPQQPIPVEDEESSRPSSVYSLNDSEVGDTISVCSEDEACPPPPPNKVDALKADLRQVVAQIAQAAKDKHSSVATKLMKARNQIKSELALAQDEMQLDAIKHELREVVAQITEATNHGDQAGVDHWMQRRAALKLQLKAVHESLDKTQRQAKPLDVLKTELRAVVTNLQRPHLTDDEMALLMAQKTELKALIMAKQPPRNPSDIDGLKAELRKVVSNITLASKERDDALVDKLMRRRADLKAALAKAQDSEQKRSSDRLSRGSSSTAASTSLHSVADPAGSFVKKLQAASSLVGNPETPQPPKHQNTLSFLSHNQQPQNESFRSNSGGGGGSLSSNSLHDDTSDSSSSSFTMSEAKVAQNALHAFKTELANIQHAMEKTTNERKMKKLLEQRADMKARIAATEEQLRPHAASVQPLVLEWDLSQVRKYTQGLQRELRDIVARSDESATSPQLKARRAELKAAIHTAFDRIALLQEEATIRDIQIPILSPHMTKDELTAHIEILKKELRQVVTSIAQTTAAGAKSKLKSQRSSIKYHLAMAQDKLAMVSQSTTSQAAAATPKPRNPKSPQDDVKMLESYIDSLKADLKVVVMHITQTADVPTVHAMHLRRRNDLKQNLRTAQDQLLALTDSRSSSHGSSNMDSGLVLDALMTSRMTQVYQNVSEKSGYLEWMPQTLKLFRGGKVVWVRLETSGCLLWFKSPTDQKVRGMVDLAATAARSVQVAYADTNLVTISILSPGMLSNHEEIMHFRATSEHEARGWVDVLGETVEVLARQFPHQNQTELFGRNSVVY